MDRPRIWEMGLTEEEKEEVAEHIRKIAHGRTKKSAEDKISKWIGEYVLSYLQNNGIPEDERCPLDGEEPLHIFIQMLGTKIDIYIPKEDMKKLLQETNNT